MIDRLFESFHVQIERYQDQMIQSQGIIPEAAVLVPIVRTKEPELLLTLRALHLEAHGGEVSFPGGGREESDQDIIQTALRETLEETGISPMEIDVIGQLQMRMSHRKIAVQPLVGFVSFPYHSHINPEEVTAIFTVPLRFFAEDHRAFTHRFNHEGVYHYIPCYHFHQYKIWGLTAGIIMELINLLYGTEFTLTQKPTSGEVLVFS